MNNKKIINLIIYAILFVVLALSVLSPLIGKELLWNPEANTSMPFNGINFDVPTNISNFKITRSINESLNRELISYDVEFKYTGDDSNMRIIGKLGEQAFFGSGVVPKKSNVVLKGDFGVINDSLFNEKLQLKDYYKKTEDYQLDSISEVRVPLTEDIGEYKFRVSYEPRKLVYNLGEELGTMAVFITNGRVDKFSDTKYEEEKTNKIETQSYVEQKIYVNLLESFDEKQISNLERNKNINNVIFILSVLASIIMIWINKKTNPFILVCLIFVNILTFYRFFNLGVATKAVVFIFPILGYIGLVLGKLINKEKINIHKHDLTQGLAGAIFMLFLGLMVYVVPKTF